MIHSPEQGNRMQFSSLDGGGGMETFKNIISIARPFTYENSYAGACLCPYLLLLTLEFLPSCFSDGAWISTLPLTDASLPPASDQPCLS